MLASFNVGAKGHFEASTLRRGSLRKSSCSDTSSRWSWMKASTLAKTLASPIELAKLRKEMAFWESILDSR